ncbi:hypothetical protein CA608_20205 [Caulobacter vibrioides]|nr:hypothetical protein CA608_20205 [Caulobacter vibrioides]
MPGAIANARPAVIAALRVLCPLIATLSHDVDRDAPPISADRQSLYAPTAPPLVPCAQLARPCVMSRRKPKLNRSAVGDLYDYLSPELPTPARPNVSPKRRVIRLPSVSDDWPDVVPISEAELRITEAYLEKVLAELLGPLP